MRIGRRHRPLLLDFGQAVMERVRFAVSSKHVVQTGELAMESLADIVWRYFDELTTVNQGVAENYTMLDKLTEALTEAAV